MKKMLIRLAIVIFLILIFSFGSLVLGEHATKLTWSEAKIGEINSGVPGGGWLGCLNLFAASVRFPSFFPDTGWPFKFAYTMASEYPNCTYREFINPAAFILDLGFFIILDLIILKLIRYYRINRKRINELLKKEINN